MAVASTPRPGYKEDNIIYIIKSD